MKWCLALGATLYSVILGAFLCVFKKFINSFRSYHRLNEMHQSSAQLSQEERNKAFNEYKENKKCKKAIKKQCQQPKQFSCPIANAMSSYRRQEAAPTAFYYPPNMEHATVQRVSEEQPRLVDDENVAPAQIAVDPQEYLHEATYTLDQVKQLLALERQRLGQE